MHPVVGGSLLVALKLSLDIKRWAETATYAGGTEKCGSGTISIAGLTVK